MKINFLLNKIKDKDQKILLIDLLSYTLPFDVAFVNQYLSRENVKLLISETSYNLDCLNYLDQNVEIEKYPITNKNKIIGFIYYHLILLKILIESTRYSKIIWQWPIFPSWVFIFYFVLKRKSQIIVHNHIDHDSIRPRIIYIFLRKIGFDFIFVSKNTKNHFEKMYGELTFSQVFPHPLLIFLKNIKKPQRLKRLTFLGNIKTLQRDRLF